MKEKKTFELGLLPKLIIGVIAGILIGSFAPEVLMRGVITVIDIFSNYLNFVVPLIILAFVVTGISDLGNGSGKILGFSVFMSYGSTVLWGVVAYIISMLLFPKMLDLSGTSIVSEMGDIEPFFAIEMPPLANITSILILAFILGIGISILKAEKIKGLFNEFHGIINMVLEKSIIPFLPWYIAGIFAQLTFSGNIKEILKSYGTVFISVVLFQIIANILEYIIAKAYNKEAPNLAQFIKNQIPSWLTAIGTQSSAATIPITLQTAASTTPPGLPLKSRIIPDLFFLFA